MQKGFTLLEIIVVLSITGLLAGIITAVGIQAVNKGREDNTIEHLKALKIAVMGNPLDVYHGTRTSFGYFGDMGALPSSIQDLYVRGTQTPYTFSQTYNTGAGWNGPYIDPQIMEYFNSLDRDYFKQQLEYPGTALPADVEGRIRSPGRDGQDATGDELSVDLFTNGLFSRVSGFVRDDAGNGVAGVTVGINYPDPANPGTLLTPAATSVTDGNGLYSFNNVPYGNRSLSITSSKLILASGTGHVVYNADDDFDVYFTILNISPNPIRISALRAVYQIDPETYFTSVRIAEVAAPGSITRSYNPGTKTVTETITFTAPRSLNNPDAPPEAVGVCVQSPVTKVPDISLLKVASKFKTDGTPQPLATGITLKGFTTNMIGVVFTVTLTDTSGNTHTFTFVP